MKSLVWFRNDLRTDDNPALTAAAVHGDMGVEAVFLIALKQWRTHDWGAPKIDFILRNVAALREKLTKLNITLHLLSADDFSDAPSALLKLAQQQRCDALFFNREYEVNEQARDESVTNQCTGQGVEVRSFHEQTILQPDYLRTGAGQFYRVFTPFKNAWLTTIKDRLPLSLSAPPKPVRAAPATADAVSHKDDALYAALRLVRCDDAISARWPAGEEAAAARLRRFTQEHISQYKQTRDFPSLDGTSSLSPYLSAGVISIRRCLLAAMNANDGRLDCGDVGITTWISELVWREFYRHVLVGFPRVSRHQPFKSETRMIRWRQSESEFKAWCEARTGVPIVDAAMRQLVATGWMHNRLRMITAMYLTKDLFIDWHRGEQFFMHHLVDADLAQNNGGWQWSASTGIDAAPYFRIFNPISQSKRFDPQGRFIRQYCPELAELDDKEIHDPSVLPPLVRSRIVYPLPIVDHAAARQRVMDSFKAIK